MDGGTASFPQGREPWGTSWNRRNFGTLWWLRAIALCLPSEQQRLLTIPATHVPPNPTHLFWLLWAPPSASHLPTFHSSPSPPWWLFACSPLEQSQPLSLWCTALSKVQLTLPFHLPSQICLHCHLYLWSLDKDIGKRILSKWVHLPERSLELAGF